jgi:hypothetical protein
MKTLLPLLFVLVGPSATPDGVLAVSREVGRIATGLQDYVATERMTQKVMDTRADRVMRKQILVSDYQIAPLEEDANALWEFRFVREIDGKPVAGADRQIEDFARLRHQDAKEERLAITKLGFDRSLPGCYWHNLTLMLLAFAGPNVDNFSWRGDGDRWTFEQVRGLGIPENLFDPKSQRHYPRGTMTLAKGALSKLEIEWQVGELITSVSLEFSAPAEPGAIPLPSRYVAKKRIAGPTQKTVVETDFDYSAYRRFAVTTEPSTTKS